MDAGLMEVRQEAERALLGVILLLGSGDRVVLWDGETESLSALTDIKSKITASDLFDSQFHDPRHAKIFTAMTHCEHPHEIAVAEELNNMGELNPGDCAYLKHLISQCPCVIAYQDFIDTIFRCSGKQTARPVIKGGI